MGNKVSGIRELKQSSNACDLSKIVTDATGIKSNSASPTDIMILDVKSGIKYQSEIFNMNKIFMKYWINDDLFIRNLLIKIGGTTANVSEFKKKSKALNYELMIYKDIIRHLVDENICTNFIRCLGSSSACDADNILYHCIV